LNKALNEQPLQRAVSTAIKAGYQVDKEAFDFMSSLPQTIDPETLIVNVIREIGSLPKKPMFIDLSLLQDEAGKILREMEEEKLKLTEISLVTEGRKTRFQAYAKGIEKDLRVVEDPTDKIQATGTLEDYIDYFQDRFKRMSRLLRQRMDVRDATSISEALKAPSNTKAKIICMITEKRESKRGIFLTVEDLETAATVYVSLEKRTPAVVKAKSVLLDQVVCIGVIKGKNRLLIAEDLILPEVPNRKPNKAPIPVYAALISDLHVGSKMFMQKEFQRFTDWLNGEFGSEQAKTIASHVKYVVIAGDLVDGVGIYPQQIDELYIKDIYKQYEVSAEILERMPDYVEVVIIPGNHDATRKAIPQPAILRQYAEALYNARKIYSLGSPSSISLHGVNILLDHGRSLDDVISLAPDMSFREPQEAMKFLVQCRHLAPTYGQRTPIASEKRDHLLIENVPDIFHAGHVHVMKYDTYRGILIVNSGAWQEQTEYQREMGHVPNPAIVPIVNLQTLEVIPIDFGASPSQNSMIRADEGG